MIALMKGYGRDEHINLLLTAFWEMATTQRWEALNIADPISRGDFWWCSPPGADSSSSQQLEAALLQLSQHTAQSFHEEVARMNWAWA